MQHEAALAEHAAAVETARQKAAEWEELSAEDGSPYYHNTVTGDTAWERPVFEAPPPPLPAPAPAPAASASALDQILGTTSSDSGGGGMLAELQTHPFFSRNKFRHGQ